MSWGDRVKSLRERQGMTQAELSAASGISRSYLAHIETGRYKTYRGDTIEKIAKGLGIQVSTLLGESERAIDLQKIENIIEVPVYNSFPFSPGGLADVVEYVPVAQVTPTRKALEGYRVNGNCLRPEIQDGDIVVVEQEGDIDSGNIVMCRVSGEVHIARLRKIAGDYFLENNHDRFKLEDASEIAPVVYLERRLK